MSDLVMGERWNPDETVEMALGIRRAIGCVMRKEEPPPECYGSLEKGVQFMSEVKGGYALILGTHEEADSFNGTFSPLCLANDVYINFSGGSQDKKENSQIINQLFSKYKETLEKLRDENLRRGIEQRTLGEIGHFFEILCDLLLQQADPIFKEYSESYPNL